MTTTATAPPTRTVPRGTLPGGAPIPPPPSRRGHTRLWIALAGAGFLVILAPVVLLAGAGNPPCTTTTGGPVLTPPVGTPTAGQFAQPLHMRPGRWYRVGATRYSGDYGSSPTQTYLPDYPHTFAELSTLDTNPANSRVSDFTFADANALGNLPYLTGIRVLADGHQMVLYKRDTGYGQGPHGQGPGSLIYRIDVWQAAADQLHITKTPVSIQLAPADGTGPTLNQTPAPQDPTSGSCGGGPPTGVLQINHTGQAQILSDGDASAPANAPRPVKLAVAAANQIDHTPYPEPDVHYDGQYLGKTWPAYDCSATVSYVLWKAGLRGIYAADSGTLESWGKAGPGRWISVYANSAHTWIVIAGRAFDTANYGGPNIPIGSGPRWRTNPTGNLNDGSSYVVRHPAGL